MVNRRDRYGTVSHFSRRLPKNSFMRPGASSRSSALRDGGVAAGLAPEVAQKLSVHTLLGAARLLAHRNIEPEILRNQVTSPNGVTFAGLKKMEAHDFRGLIKDTILTAKARSEEMAKDR